MLARRGIEFNELNRSQALVPDTLHRTVRTRHGTAPGMWFETAEGGVVVSLPGVPFEMEHLMQDEVMPRLKHHFSLHANIHRTMITAGLAESMLAARIADWENALPKGIKLAYLPSPNVVRLRLSAYDVEDADATRKTIDNLFDRLYDIIPAIYRRLRGCLGAGAGTQAPHGARIDPRHGGELHGRCHRLALHGHGRRLGILSARGRHIQQRGQARRAGRKLSMTSCASAP